MSLAQPATTSTDTAKNPVLRLQANTFDNEAMLFKYFMCQPIISCLCWHQRLALRHPDNDRSLLSDPTEVDHSTRFWSLGALSAHRVLSQFWAMQLVHLRMHLWSDN